MWPDFIKNTILRPGLERLGTIAATALLAGGDALCVHWDVCGLVTAGGAETTAQWVVAAALVMFDVAVIHLNRRKGKR